MPTAHAFVIETDSTAAGIVVRQDHGFRFFSAHRDYHHMDGDIFATVEAAARAVRWVGPASHPADIRDLTVRAPRRPASVPPVEQRIEGQSARSRRLDAIIDDLRAALAAA